MEVSAKEIMLLIAGNLQNQNKAMQAPVDRQHSPRILLAAICKCATAQIPVHLIINLTGDPEEVVEGHQVVAEEVAEEEEDN